MPWKIFFRIGCANSLFKALIICLVFFLPWSLQSYERIVSLKPNLTEILFSLGLGNKIVGVTTFCNYPPEAQKIDKVSDYLQPDIEKLLAKKPDLIVTSEENSQRREIEYLQRKGYKVLTYPTDTLDQVRTSILKLGIEVGKTEEARKILADFDAQLQRLQSKVLLLQQQKPAWKNPRTLFIVGQHPLIVAGSGNLIDDIAPYLGLQNAVSKSKLKYPSFSVEQVYAVAPEYIINFAMGTESSEKARQEAQEEIEKMKALPAVRNKQIYFWDIGALRASPRLPQELLKFFEVLHPSQKEPS